MTSNSICLVGKESLLKEGVKSLLARKNFFIAGDYDDLVSIPLKSATGFPVQLFVCIDEAGNELLKIISKLKNIYTQSHIAVISGNTDTALVKLAFDAGATAFISKDTPCADIVNAMKLAAAGKEIRPVGTPSLPAANTNQDNSVRNTGNYNLSKQELKIVHGLANGDPNKVIAYHLSISESTVKVHVKTILRKLGTTNRTKAAILAISQGLVPASKQLQAG